MPTDEEKLDRIERELNDEQARSRDLKKHTDKLDNEVDPPAPAIDHADDGGVI